MKETSASHGDLVRFTEYTSIPHQRIVTMGIFLHRKREYPFRSMDLYTILTETGIQEIYIPNINSKKCIEVLSKFRVA